MDDAELTRIAARACMGAALEPLRRGNNDGTIKRKGALPKISSLHKKCGGCTNSTARPWSTRVDQGLLTCGNGYAIVLVRSSISKEDVMPRRRRQIVSESSEDVPSVGKAPEKNPAAVALGRLGGIKGGAARAAKLSASRRSEIARIAAQKRWHGEDEAQGE